jgi:hypothetical protein
MAFVDNRQLLSGRGEGAVAGGGGEDRRSRWSMLFVGDDAAISNQ